MTASPAPASGSSELGLRVASGVAMGLAAIGLTVWGGWPYALVWALLAAAVAWEWQRITGGDAALAGTAAAAAAAAALGLAAYPADWRGIAFVVLALAPVGLARAKGLVATGQIYALALGVAAILCRGAEPDGAVLVFWLFAVVWGTDICAYFTGRRLGGPKLWPKVSPKKTWSGAIGGLVGGVLLGSLLLWAAEVPPRWPHVMLSIAFSVLTQLGDLYESALKRRFGAKDSGQLIPGHGGVMDRLDGYIFAVVFAALFGSLRAGPQAVPAGLLQWP